MINPWHDRTTIGRGYQREQSRGSVRNREHTALTEQHILRNIVDPPVLSNLDFHISPQSPLQNDLSSSDDEATRMPTPSKSSRPSGHTRSMSHPFPSLFSLKKKLSASDNIGARRPSKDSDDDLRAPCQRQSPPEPSISREKTKLRLKAAQNPIQLPSYSHSRGSSGGSKDFSVGNCMTCSAPIRWPKDVRTFKCIRCMTVVDLHPRNPGQKPPHSQRRDRSREPDREGGSVPVPMSPRSNATVIPSTETTKMLIHKCLKLYLNSKLATNSQTSLESPTFHPSNPFFKPPQYTHQPTRPKSPNNSNTRPNYAPPIYVSDYIDNCISQQPTSKTHKMLQYNSSNHNSYSRQLSTSYPDRKATSSCLSHEGNNTINYKIQENEAKCIFKHLEDYLISCFSTFDGINTSFRARRPSVSGQRPSMGPRPSFGGAQRPDLSSRKGSLQTEAPSSDRKQSFAIDRERIGSISNEPVLTDFDAKLLLVGDVAENGLWWTGNQDEIEKSKAPQRNDNGPSSLVNGRSPCIDWADMEEWYATLINTGKSWKNLYEEILALEKCDGLDSEEIVQIELHIMAGQNHIQRLLLKLTEMMLKRPGRVVTEPHELRFLLILASNPLIHGFHSSSKEKRKAGKVDAMQSRPQGPVSGDHSGIIKRILGLISNTPIECHNHLISWFSRFPVVRFRKFKDLISGFITYRLSRQHAKAQEAEVDVTGGLIPDMPSGRAGHSAASLHAALGGSHRQQKPHELSKKVMYDDDWQVKAAARVMALLFTANNMSPQRAMREISSTCGNNESALARDRIHTHDQIVPTSEFYLTMLDYSDLVADYDAWESKRGRFSFCQFPFFLSIWSKIKIMDHDTKRQMGIRAREALFDSIMSRKAANQYLVLKVRRECLVDDSLKRVSEVVGSGSEDIKKGLKIDFVGEEGVDAGGLRKEWFQILIREVFHPDHGMFIYDEDSRYCYFNPNSLETSDQFFLVGVVLGLAIYNSTILDVAFPPFAFRKLLSAAPLPALPGTYQRQSMHYTLDDLAEYRPRLAKGLQQLLDFDGDVESTFCLDFVIEVERYGAKSAILLCPGGERMPVTNTNRREYVDLVVRYHLDVAVTRQFEPFKRGFFTICGGNALGLFRPEEIELLVRGSDESLDISSLKAVAEYDGWKSNKLEPPMHSSTMSNIVNPTPRQVAEQTARQRDQNAAMQRRRALAAQQVSSASLLTQQLLKPEETEPTIKWFWETFEEASVQDQRKLLTFITGSDRIPATGATSLVIKVTCLGDDCGRYPIARTCFNMISLHRYRNKERLEHLLWGAVEMGGGFGLK